MAKQSGKDDNDALQECTTSRQDLEQALETMVERIATLEQTSYLLREKLVSSTNLRKPTSSSNSATNEDVETPSTLPPPENEGFFGTTSLLQQFETLQKCVDHAQTVMDETRHSSRATSPEPVRWEVTNRDENKGLHVLEQEARKIVQSSFDRSVNAYFEYVNPQYRALNEKWFRERLADFIESVPTANSKAADKYQFLALLNLMHAEMLILSEHWSKPLKSTRAPGWEWFSRADNILNHLTWLGQGNFVTLHCYLIAARYLMYVEKPKAAYDFISKAVGLCWSLGLHDQRSWTGCDAFETIMRQRAFWALFHIERRATFSLGAPYLIRKCDIHVGFPPDVEDQFLARDKAVPDDCWTNGSLHEYTRAITQWGEFCAEIWDSCLCASAERPSTQEFITAMDLRIEEAVVNLPRSLKWEQQSDQWLQESSAVIHSNMYQSANSLLMFNQLRLLLRQECMLNLTHDDNTAHECVSIASQSINVAHSMYHAAAFHSSDRFMLCVYLVGGLIPLICVILRKANNIEHRSAAAAAFQRNHSLLRDMAPGFSVARHSLQRMNRIIATTQKVIGSLGEDDLVSTLPSFEDFDFTALDNMSFLDLGAEVNFNEYLLQGAKPGNFLV
ncbi:hypothetical protein LTS07_009277 [Exophiala sideris]|nr:hypothetical protein LTS07_009277 [Exophiala sideris]